MRDLRNLVRFGSGNEGHRGRKRRAGMPGRVRGLGLVGLIALLAGCMTPASDSAGGLGAVPVNPGDSAAAEPADETNAADTPTGDGGAATQTVGRLSSLADLDGQYLVAIDTHGIELPSDQELTIEFADGRISPHTGCNHFGGQYQIIDDTLVLTEFYATEMFCDGWPGVAETWLASLLSATPHIAVVDGNLQIWDATAGLTLTPKPFLAYATIGGWGLPDDLEPGAAPDTSQDARPISSDDTVSFTVADADGCLVFENTALGTVLPVFQRDNRSPRRLSVGQHVDLAGEGPFDEVPERLPNILDTLEIPESCPAGLPYWIVW